MKRWPLFTVAAIALLLIPIRIIWPNLKIDNTSLLLLCVAVMALLVALLPIKRLKWGEFEAELDRELDSFNKTVKVVEATTHSRPRTKHSVVTLQENQSAQRKKDNTDFLRISDEFFSILNASSSNVEKILAASILLERVVGAVAVRTDPNFVGNVVRAITELKKNDGISSAEESALREAWDLRNKMVHMGMDPTNEQLTRFLDILWRLIHKLA